MPAACLRAPPLTLENEAAKLEADVQADFNTGEVSADGTITYKPGIEALVGSEPALRFSLDGPLATAGVVYDSEPLAQFLTQRALEAEQARVEAMQASLLEKQRLRREVRYYAALQEEHDKAMDVLRKQEEEARQKAEAEAEEARKAAEEARQKAEAEERAADEARQAEEAKAAAAPREGRSGTARRRGEGAAGDRGADIGACADRREVAARPARREQSSGGRKQA